MGGDPNRQRKAIQLHRGNLDASEARLYKREKSCMFPGPHRLLGHQRYVLGKYSGSNCRMPFLGFVTRPWYSEFFSLQISLLVYCFFSHMNNFILSALEVNLDLSDPPKTRILENLV